MERLVTMIPGTPYRVVISEGQGFTISAEQSTKGINCPDWECSNGWRPMDWQTTNTFNEAVKIHDERVGQLLRRGW